MVLFEDRSNNLVPGFVGSNGAHIFAYDRITNTVSVVDHKAGSPTTSGNQLCAYADISADGSTAVFTTAASDIISGVVDANGADDVFVRNVATGATALASRRFGSPSLSAGGDSAGVQESADGRYVVYVSKATNLVAGQVDSEGTQDVFLYDRQLNTTTLVSHAFDSATTAASGGSGAGSAIPVISGDGRYVAYTSYSTNLVSGFVDSNGTGVPGNGGYSGVDVYLFDRVTGTNILVSHQAGTNNVGGNQTSGTYLAYPDYLLTISSDGRYVAYFSLATDLVAGFVDNNGTTPSNNAGSDIFVYDRVTDTNTLVSHTPGANLNGGNDSSYGPSISEDGRYIAYWGYSYTLVSGMAAVHARNVFVYDQQTDLTALASHNVALLTLGGNGWSDLPEISQDGNYVAYESAASNLVSGSDTNGQNDIFLYNRSTQVNTLVSHAYNSSTTASNTTANIDSSNETGSGQVINNDGRYVTYASSATNLVAGFIEGYPTNPSDVYLFDRLTGTNTLLSHQTGSASAGGNRYSRTEAISGDGRFVAFQSVASNLVPSYTSSTGTFSAGDIYVYDRVLGTTTLATHTLSANNVGGDGDSIVPVLSADGSVISFISDATTLIAGDFNSHTDVFAYVTTPPQVASLQINDGSAQRSTVRSITVTFDEPVFFNGDPALAFSLTRNGSAGNVQIAVVSYMNSPNGVVTLNFSGPLTEFGSLIDGQYSLTIDASQVKNIANLDGTGAGVAGVDWVSQPGAIFRLFGDANGDGTVSASDFILFRMNFGGNADMFDFNGDGSVSASDFVQFRLRFGGSI
jgi:hypothetical protein